MRIQHNIMAMNAYRNYNTNTNALSKNLEKLSSGYKINRAGDDAAGLAISEKMRAQITGLKAATKNVKDGVSLVKTAEGAMQEIQDMLNRMDYLATQSANGTYDKEVDRANLQKEVVSLRAEINRIADSANFNGIKLLNGDWQGATTLASVQTGGAGSASTAFSVGAVTGTMANGSKTTTATKAEFVMDYSKVTGLEKDKGYIIGGVEKDIGGTAATDLAAAFDNVEVTIDGNTYIASDAGGGKIKFTAKTAGDLTAETDATNAGLSAGAANAPGANPTGAGEFVANSNVDGFDAGTPIAAKTEIELKNVTKDNAPGSTLTIGGKTYEFVKAGEDVTDANNEKIEVEDTDDAAALLTKLETAVKKDTGVTGKFTVDTDGTKLTITETANPASGTQAAITVKGSGFKAAAGAGDDAAGLQLQIGDTADGFNQLFVEIGDMHTDAMDISDINIGDQTGAAAAITKIKDAINYVSSVRGDLGATQNRLDHTLNNLSVMTENIQDAESTIRDTDVAEEMMAYTKNNILIQSAQAMLAQANAVPQGVLQLLG